MHNSMTTISSILSKTPGFAPDSAGKNDTPMDGAFAIFEAVLANLADQQLGSDGQDQPTPAINAEALLDQIMADDSISPYIETVDGDALLPILEQVLENPDQMKSLLGTIPQSVSDHNQDIATDPLIAPEAQNETALIAPVSPLPMQNKVSTSMTTVFTAPSVTRGHYHQPKNPVQALASLLRKMTPAPETAPSAVAQAPQAKPSLTSEQTSMGPFPQHSVEAQRVAAHLNELTITAVKLTKSSAAIAQTEARPAAPLSNMAATIANGLPMDTPEDSDFSRRPSPIITVAKPEAVTAKSAPQTDDAIDIPYIKPVLFKPSDNPFKTMTIKPDLVMAEGQSKVIEAQTPRPASMASAQSAASVTLTSSGGDMGGQSGQNNSAQSGINTTMGLDQGRDGRLLRLSVSDQGWHERLVRQISTGRSGSSNERITVMLQPRNLGRMTLNISIANNTTHVHIVTSTPEAAALMQDAEARLHQAFDQNGMKLGQFQTANQFGQHHHAQQGMSQQGTQDGNGQNAPHQTAENARKDANLDENSSTKTVENANNSQINILA
ncbi:MAG: flagellar hook-length control protein FliK [Alphaproteobacteria bacterium]|nr:flagellar hook-length control protein FliK [Alphaproteobacteria bacterium]